MPWLVHRAGPGNVEPDLHEVVGRAQDCFADGLDPWVGGDVDKTSERWRVHFDIPAVRDPPDGGARAAASLLERGVDVLG